MQPFATFQVPIVSGIRVDSVISCYLHQGQRKNFKPVFDVVSLLKILIEIVSKSGFTYVRVNHVQERSPVVNLVFSCPRTNYVVLPALPSKFALVWRQAMLSKFRIRRNIFARGKMAYAFVGRPMFQEICF